MLGLEVTLITISSDPLSYPLVKLTPNLKVPVRVGVPETIPVSVPEKKSGRLVNVNVGYGIPLTLNLTS